MANFNEILKYGMANKKKKEDILNALIQADQYNATADALLERLDKQGAFGAKDTTGQDPLAIDRESLTADQNKSYGFGTRTLESGKIVNSLENEIAQKGFGESLKLAAEEKAAGGTITGRFASPEVQKFDQAKRDFINAVLRRESGAAIAPEEFANAEKQYFPVPGDSPETVDQKRRNRELVTKNLLGEAGVNVENLQASLAGVEKKQAADKQAIADKFNTMYDWAQANPKDERAKRFMDDWDNNRFDLTTGKLKEEFKELTPYEKKLKEQTGEGMETMAGAQEGMGIETGAEPTQIDEEKKKQGGLLTRIARGVGDFLGGEKIGEAIGEVAGGALAKHGKSGEKFAQNVANIENLYQQGKIDEEERNNLLDTQDELARESFGYDGPDTKQIAGDIAKIGLTFAGGGVAKGVTTAGKIGRGVVAGAKFGAAGGAAEALTEGESVTEGAIAGATAGAVTGGLFGVGGKVIGKGVEKLREAADVEGRAQKLATEILQPTKKELEKAIKKGGAGSAVDEFVKTVRKSKDFNELRTNTEAITSTLFDERNKILNENNFQVSDYLTPLKNKISEIEKSKLATPSQVNRMKEILKSEEEWVAEQGGSISRLDAQARKEAIQDLTQPLLKKREAGTLAQDEANEKVALDAVRAGLKEAVEGGDDKIRDINSRYEGLNRVRELLSGREALAMKAQDQTLLQKTIAPIIEIMSAGTGAGSAAFVARQAAKQESNLSKLTGKLEKLAKGKGGPFAEAYNLLKKMKGKQGKIGDVAEDLGDFFTKKKALRGREVGLSIKDVSKIDGQDIPTILDRMDREDASIMEEFIDNTRLRKGENVDLEVKARRMAEAMGLNADVTNAKLANKFGSILEFKFPKK